MGKNNVLGKRLDEVQDVRAAAHLLDLFLRNFLLGLDSAEEDVEPDGAGVQCLQDGRMVSDCISKTLNLRLGLTGS